MNNKQIYLILVAITIVSVFSFVAFTEPINATTKVVTEETSWIDNFDTGTLDSRWIWIRENPTYWSLTANPGFLRLTTRGSLNQTSNTLENILLTPMSGIDYRIITKLTFSPTENYHRAGLLVYEDDDNYIQLTRVYSDGDYVRIRTEIGGVTSYTYAPDVVAATTLYLRFDKYANDYYGFYSIDGVVWEFVGQYNLPLSNTYVGLFAAYGPTVTEIDADFDYFEFIPRTYNTTWVDEFNSTTLNSSWSWLNEDPTHWSLANNPGFLQIITQNGGIFGGTYHNLLVKDAPSDDYRITTKATISPTEDFQGASIIVYSDDNNYIRLSRRFSSLASGGEVNFRHESNDVLVVNIGVNETATTVYLRINKEDELYSGYYSTDGNSYTYIGQTSTTMTNPKIGILSGSGPSTTEIPSDYDFFEIEYYQHKIYLPISVKNYSVSEPQSSWVVAGSYDGYPQGISMLSEENGWILGSTLDGLLHRWDGENWAQTHTITHTQSIVRGDVAVVSASDGWAVLGGPLGTDGESRIYRWTGSTWDYNTTLTNPNELSASALDVVAPDDVWLTAGFAFGSFLYHWNGSTWGLVDTLWLPMVADDDLDMISASDGWSVGFTGKIAHWDGLDWAEITSPVSVALNGISMVSSSDGWIVGDAGTILRWDNASWAAVTSPTSEDLYDVFMVSADTGWAVGDAGTILMWNGTDWTTQSSLVTSSIRKIHMLSETEGWAITTGGEILHFTPNVP